MTVVAVHPVSAFGALDFGLESSIVLPALPVIAQQYTAARRPPPAKRAHSSGHADGLQKYARPGVDGVAEFTADHAPPGCARG